MALLLFYAFCATQSVQSSQQPVWKIVGAMPDKQELALLLESLESGRQRIELFFGKPFNKSFEVEVFPDRSAFDQYFSRRWKVSKTQSWMVASGVSDKLTILSSKVWKTQASEHKPDDENHYRELIAHEMVHVYHGQRNPTGDFEDMDDLGWLVEGMAVYVSGQLEKSHENAARDAVRLGKVPKSLAQAWSGKYRYGVCGSMVQWIDRKWGRAKLIELLMVTQQEDALKILACSEREFLINWEQSVKRSMQLSEKK
jgi:hypothetical protein